jgi:hypothetical protein
VITIGLVLGGFLRALRFDEKIYGFRLHFLFGVTEKTVKTYVKEHLKTDDISFSFSDTWFGKCAYREANGIPHIILMLKDVPKLGCPKFHSKLNHEIVIWWDGSPKKCCHE